MRNEVKQKEPGRRWFLATAISALCLASPTRASDKLDTGGLTFLDFATLDNGASFSRTDPIIAGGPSPPAARILGIDSARGFARVRFEQIRVTVAVPLGWQASEDWERGVGFSNDKRYRLVVWRVDFDYEGVKDAEHYASTKAGAIQARRPGVKAQARKLGDGSFLVVFENAPKAQGDSEQRTVFDVVIPQPDNPKLGVLLTLGVPASESGRGIKLLAILRESMKIDR